MIAETGHAALWLACALSALGALRPEWARTAAVAAALCAGAALWALGRSFAYADFSVAAVREGVNLAMGAETRLAALLAARTPLLAVCGVAAVTAALALMPPRITRAAHTGALRLMLGTVAVLTAVTLALRPFARIDPAPTDGIGIAGALQTAGPDWGRVLYAVALGLCLVLLALRFATARRLFGSGVPRALRFWLFATVASLTTAWAVRAFADDGPSGLEWLAGPVFLTFVGNSLSNRARRLRALGPAGRAGRVALLVGVMLALAGAGLDLAVRDEAVVQLSPGETAGVGGKRVALDGLMPVAGPGYTAVRAAVRVGGAAFAPERRVYFAPLGEVSPPDRGHGIAGWTDVSLIPADGRWRVRVVRRPFAHVAPLGLALVALGAAALAGAQLRLPRRRRRRSWDRRAACA